ncbi:MTERF5 [Symbiodinium sp. CCMP2456]|nr:MTERF5 [Symbiodinium sp. CCMP2456]
MFRGKGSRGISWRYFRAASWLLGCFALGLAACGPVWWRKGRPRTMHRSYAEVELLSRMAELLMPGEPIGELFRDFPVEPSDSWGSRWLCPGITAFGMLKDEDAALFVEYDGHPRHYDERGQEKDERLRIGHAARELRWTKNSREVVIDTWSAGQERTLIHVVRQVAQALLGNWGNVLRKEVCQHLRRFGAAEPVPDLDQASKFTSKAVLTSDIETKKTNVTAFLEQELKFSTKGVRALARKFPRIWGISIERLKSTVALLEDVGLSRKQVAKVVAGLPALLGCSIDGNLKPTLAWLEDVGLSRQQVAKVVAGFPQLLGCSIDGNLKVTVAWLEDDVGLTRVQVAKVVAAFPQVLGCSIDNNLLRKHFLLQQFYSQEQICSMVVYHPAMLGYRPLHGRLQKDDSACPCKTIPVRWRPLFLSPAAGDCFTALGVAMAAALPGTGQRQRTLKDLHAALFALKRAASWEEAVALVLTSPQAPKLGLVAFTAALGACTAGAKWEVAAAPPARSPEGAASHQRKTQSSWELQGLLSRKGGVGPCPGIIWFSPMKKGRCRALTRGSFCSFALSGPTRSYFVSCV